jgi:hypothetical protein
MKIAEYLAPFFQIRYVLGDTFFSGLLSAIVLHFFYEQDTSTILKDTTRRTDPNDETAVGYLIINLMANGN